MIHARSIGHECIVERLQSGRGDGGKGIENEYLGDLEENEAIEQYIRRLLNVEILMYSSLL